LIATMVPRQTPTQVALLPPETQETSYFDILFAPLTWEASTNWTILEWMRYFYLRYAVDWALVMVIFFGTFSRDLMHVGYLILPFYFLRTRDSLSMDSLMGLRILQLYNVSVIGAILLYQAPLEGLLGDWYVSRTSITIDDLESKRCTASSTEIAVNAMAPESLIGAESNQI